MNRIRGKTAVVTGATAGIGEATTRSLADSGVHTVLLGRRSDRLESIAADIVGSSGTEVRTYVLDVRDRAGVAAFTDWLEREGVTVDILINNAGLSRGLDTVQEGKDEDWDDMIDTNIKGLLNMTRALLPGMIARDSRPCGEPRQYCGSHGVSEGQRLLRHEVRGAGADRGDERRPDRHKGADVFGRSGNGGNRVLPGPFSG